MSVGGRRLRSATRKQAKTSPMEHCKNPFDATNVRNDDGDVTTLFDGIGKESGACPWLWCGGRHGATIKREQRLATDGDENHVENEEGEGEYGHDAEVADEVDAQGEEVQLAAPCAIL